MGLNRNVVLDHDDDEVGITYGGSIIFPNDNSSPKDITYNFVNSMPSVVGQNKTPTQQYKPMVKPQITQVIKGGDNVKPNSIGGAMSINFNPAKKPKNVKLKL